MTMSGLRKTTAPRLITVLAMLTLPLVPLALADDKPKEAKSLSCEMTYTIKGWSAIYKTAKGKGTITCANGQKADVKISIHGGGITFGKTEIVDGKAKISGGHTMEDIYGSYAQASAHAGAGKAADASVLTKGEVSIALSGTGTGVDVGVDFSGFKISKADAPDDEDDKDDKAPPPPPEKK